MNDQELLLKTNDELTEIVNNLMSKIKHLMEIDKTSPRRSEYFEDLQTVMGILKQRQGWVSCQSELHQWTILLLLELKYDYLDNNY